MNLDAIVELDQLLPGWQRYGHEFSPPEYLRWRSPSGHVFVESRGFIYLQGGFGSGLADTVCAEIAQAKTAVKKLEGAK